MPPSADISDLVFADRYARPGEATRLDTYRRVATALARCEPAPDRARHAARFFDNFLAGAIGAGRIMANAGTGGDATMVNCFVQPAIDAAPGRPASVDAALARAVRTLRMGGGVGYDFTPVPPAGTGTGGVCAAIDRYDQACQALAASGRRRGAQMAVLACDHPDLPAFLRAKARPSSLADVQPFRGAERPLPAGGGTRRILGSAPRLPAGAWRAIAAGGSRQRRLLALHPPAGETTVGVDHQRGLA